MKNPTFRKYRRVEPGEEYTVEPNEEYWHISDDFKKELETMDPVMIRILEKHIAKCIRQTLREITYEQMWRSI